MKKLGIRKVSIPQSVSQQIFRFYYTENICNRRHQIRVFSIHTNKEKCTIMVFSQRFLWRMDSSGTRRCVVVLQTFRRISKVDQPEVKALRMIFRG